MGGLIRSADSPAHGPSTSGSRPAPCLPLVTGLLACCSGEAAAAADEEGEEHGQEEEEDFVRGRAGSAIRYFRLDGKSKGWQRQAMMDSFNSLDCRVGGMGWGGVGGVGDWPGGWVSAACFVAHGYAATCCRSWRQCQ